MDRNGRNGGFPKTVYTSRTKSALSAKAPKSSSAMSTRTYSRIRGSADQSGDAEKGLRKNMSFDEASPYAGNAPTAEEMENERELLQRMIDQQRQLQDLQERQKRILDLQHQLASMDQSSGSVMEEKLAKLKAAKSRLDELQELVGTIKSAETPEKKGAGDNAAKRLDDKNQRIRKALDELNDLKSLINMMSISQYDNKDSSAIVKPVFHNSIGNAVQARESEEDYKPVLPEVSVVQQDDEDEIEESDGENRPPYFRESPLLKAFRSKDKSTPVKSAPKFLDPFYASKKVQKNKESRRTKRDSDVSERLYSEMRRHETLLKELRERRKELDELMNVTRTESEADADYNDANESTRSNIGSPDDSRGLSDAEENGDFETSQSGRLFGLNESDTRRLIDIIRNQKSLGATTEKTTATWGSSSSGSDDEEDVVDESAMNDSRSRSMAPPKEVVEAVLQSKDQSGKGSPNRDEIRESLSLLQEAKERYEQRPYRGEYEIDFRPPTRRRKDDSVQPKRDAPLFTAAAWKAMIDKLQEDLSSSNATMHLLLEDQQALTRLLQNTLNLQQSSISSNMCYGISPDFLIYQLDNCSAQFTALQKETKSLQWQLYDLTKNPPSGYRQSSGASTGNRAAYVMPFDKLPLDFLAKSKLEDLEYESDDECRKTESCVKLPSNGKSVGEHASVSRQRNESLSEKLEKAGVAENDDTTDLFEALRDSIYSEAAILISQNEARPHFLIELFHSLQKLNTDYLRQHCLYVLQDVMKGYLPESPRKQQKAKYSSKEKQTRDVKKTSVSENTPSESAATSEDELYAKLKAKASAEGGYDFSLKVSSASELSTPSGEEVESNPFASEDLGSTVIHLDAALRHMREMERIKQEISSSAGTNLEVQEDGAAGKGTTGEVAQVDTKLLRTRIKHIVSEVIPILKNNRDKMLDADFLKNLQQKVVQIVARTTQQNGVPEERGDSEDKDNLTNFFSGQLNSILEDALQKFLGQRVGACGEDLVIGLSEVLFNELAFYTMMQDLGKEKARPAKTTIPTIKVDQEDDSQLEVERPNGDEDADAKQEQDKDSDSSVTNDIDAEEGQEDSSGEAKTDATGKTGEPVTVDLSVSETKPLTSYGSGEDEEDGSGDDFTYKETDVPTSMQHDQDATAPQEEEVKKDDNQPDAAALEAKSGSETASDQD